MERYSVRADDGWVLGVRRLAHQGPCRGAALLLPAMMVDVRTFDRPRGRGFAHTLAAAGFDVHLADFRGHGESGPGVAEGGRWDYDDLVFRDVPALVEAVRERDPGRLWVVGHSLGGHVSAATAAAGAHTIAPDGHVLLASNVWMPSLEGSKRRTLLKSLGINAFRRVSGALGRFPSRSLRLGPVDEPLPYVEDLSRFWVEDTWQSRDGRVDYLESLPAVRGPLLCVTGAGDRLLGHVEGVRAFAEAFGPGRAEFWFGQDGELGLAWNPDHMGLLTDPRSRPVWERIARWMVEHG